MSISETLQKALKHHQKGELQQAEAIYRQVLQLEPNNADALHLLGMIAYRAGKNETAIELIEKAIAVNQAFPIYHNNAGTVYHTLNKLDKAIACYHRALSLKPNDHVAYTNLGCALKEQGKLEEAVACHQRALSLKPDFYEAHANLGCALKEQGKLEEAIACHQRALSLKPGDHKAHINMGNALQEQDKLEEAIACYQRALFLNPDFYLAHTNLGNVLQKQGKLEEAVACHQRALSLKPGDHMVHTNLGNALLEQGKLEEAVACYRRALSLNPGDHKALTNMGGALWDQGKIEEAVACHQRALSLKPDFYLTHTNLGVALQGQGKIAEALACYQRALSLKPDFYLAHFNLSIIYLLKGNLKEGWEKYKYRLLKQDIVKSFNLNYPDFSQPYWDGSEIKGKTILLCSEQGFGDTIQFIRYVPMVLKKCDKIIVACQEELIPLIQLINGIQQVVAQGKQLPDFDFHCPLLNLPSVFNTTLETVPATIPYIANDPQKVLKWHERLQSDSAKLKIGLCWAGSPTHKNDRNRSIPLNMFSMLGEMESISFYSLQKGKGAEQANNTPDGMDIVDYTNDLNDFSETAALIENLDLIISVDTSIAHLAGALGKPVWTLLPFMPDWRWLLDRTDTPWYPTMRLFRQSSIGDWSKVMISIKDALAHSEI